MKTSKVLGLDVPWQLQQLADAGNRAAPFAALHGLVVADCVAKVVLHW
jgi:hypothetical protein